MALTKMWLWTCIQMCVYLLVTGVSSPVSIPSLPCPSGCTTCETLPHSSYVIRATCSGVPPSALPTSVRELRVKNAVFPGVLTPDSFENKTDLTLLEMTNSTGCGIIWNKAFSVCSKLNNLLIENTDLLQVGELSFWGLVGLETLSLKNNKLMKINKAFVHVKKLTHLDLSFNELHQITSNMFQGLTKLYELRIQGNLITNIDTDAFSDLTDLHELVLAQNQITIIDSGLFQGLSNLRKLDIKDNKITTIKAGAFNGTTLDQLDLGDNSLTAFPSVAFKNLTKSPKQINLAKNTIVKLDDFLFDGLTSQYLDLSQNKISSVSNKAFEGCSILMVLLERNNISTMPTEVLPFWRKARVVSIGGNPWQCDCDLLWMVQFVTNSSPRKYRAHGSSPVPTCARTAKYAKKLFNQALPGLEADCITTTTAVLTTTTTIASSTLETTETTPEATTKLDTTTTSIVYSTTRMTTTTTNIPTTTTTPAPTTAEPTTITTVSTKEIVTPEKVASKPDSLSPGLWIGLAVLATILLAGFIVWFLFGKKKQKTNNNKIKPEDLQNEIPPMVTPRMIQVQAPASTAMPNFSTSKKKISENLMATENPTLKLHNSNTLQTTSLA
ncbi:leucine-rich repeat-containing protein 15-like [Liolophura sinensis]|uniref:leucine-rich repeat-containing protein 15-like n=1 Tax=Liolophura sinensis TaxID=3198878 RepID=UPI0031592DB3